MHSEKIEVQDSAAVSLTRGGSADEQIKITGRYDVKCLGADGSLKWEDAIENLVVTVGKNDLLDKYFSGFGYNAIWYMGLVDNTSFSAYAATDTLGTGGTPHPGWLEYLNYTISGSSTNRANLSWFSASAGSKATTATTFTISGAGGTVLGALMCTTQARNTASNGGAGILYSAGTFTGGSRAVVAGDSLVVTYTASA